MFKRMVNLNGQRIVAGVYIALDVENLAISRVGPDILRRSCRRREEDLGVICRANCQRSCGSSMWQRNVTVLSRLGGGHPGLRR